MSRITPIWLKKRPALRLVSYALAVALVALGIWLFRSINYYALYEVMVLGFYITLLVYAVTMGVIELANESPTEGVLLLVLVIAQFYILRAIRRTKREIAQIDPKLTRHFEGYDAKLAEISKILEGILEEIRKKTSDSSN